MIGQLSYLGSNLMDRISNAETTSSNESSADTGTSQEQCFHKQEAQEKAKEKAGSEHGS